ncbi:hypothetical protein M409DRAFT_55152 [Zasmidium cellare ATCC 36951]|uniref:Heterokaryon incompatibility domain-containing protein n=1 Tax=Zasmidium cellare ATCC 36951 TaxID=1080233 RepID=A0A6A6CJE4_ZASCE|nr:uncharacterized protein M409DRAFT_55152 [Zasmidium cellare ATCC 36951]KAF2166308.1 hypothetical protein M409DRAFT_55152 [Zasmidium cellare ATCC 36951]
MGYAEAWAGLNTAESLGTHLDSPGVVSKIQKWLHDCETLHDNEHCREAAKTVLPSKVIAVGSLDEPFLRLEQTSGRTGKYIALSHCWGGCNEGQTLQSNLTGRLQTIDDSELSKTFRDAIRCARKLGVPHLWIDSLCIIQDSASDWESKSARMCDVYSNAYFVLVASSAIADNVGFLNEVPEQYRGIPLESAPASGCYDMVIQQQIPHATGPAGAVGSPAPVAAINIGPLETRGWCFQETLLARRSIGFTSYEVAFECHDHVACECNSSNRTDAAGIDSESKETIQQQWMYVAAEDLDGGNSEKHLWRRPLSQITNVGTLYMEWRRMIVPNYTSRQLTFASDKLPALSGIAALAHRLCQDHLLWRADQWRSSLPGPGPLLFCPDYSTGPSFSWASVDGSIVYNVPEDGLGDVRLKILDCQVELAGEQKNRFGARSGGWMRVRKSFQFHLQGRCIRDGSSDDYTLKPAWSEGGMEDTEFDPDCLLSELSTHSERGVSKFIARAKRGQESGKTFSGQVTGIMMAEVPRDKRGWYQCAMVIVSENGGASNTHQRIGFAALKSKTFEAAREYVRLAPIREFLIV